MSAEIRVQPNQRLLGFRILVVEDSIDNQMLAGRILSLAGASVEFANNGLEGVEKASAGTYQVILMDIQMPELDGYGATQRLRQNGYRRPIVALTAHAMKQEREKCLANGFDDHLSKPIHREALIEVVWQYGQNPDLDRKPGSVTNSSPQLLKASVPY